MEEGGGGGSRGAGREHPLKGCGRAVAVREEGQRGVRGGQARGKRRQVEERGAGEAGGARRPASPSPELTPTDWGLESPPPPRYAPPPIRRGPGMVAGWRAGNVAELVR